MTCPPIRLAGAPTTRTLRDTGDVEFACVERNLRDSFRILARHCRSGEVREYDGVSIASAGVVFQMFNAAFLSSPVESEADLERRISICSVHFRMRGLDWACWVCENWLPEGLRKRARQMFRDHHLHLSVELPGMIAEQLPAPRRALPSLDVRRVRGGTLRDDFCAVGSVCFNVPLPWFQEVFASNTLWDDFVCWVGYLGGEPVSTAATVAGDGVVGIYNVATLPGHQRHGYGEAVMRHAVAAAQLEHGVARTILQSTSQGFRLYERLGYRTVAKVAVYSS